MIFKKLLYLFTLGLLLVSCKPSYTVTHIQDSVVRIDSTFDAYPQPQMHALVQKYKTLLDKEMNQVIGTSAQFMDYGIPESLLTNFTSDVMKAYGDEHLPGGADIAVMNVHGHRATMPKGEITIGNIYEIYSFDNTIVFLDLKGTDLNDIFRAYAGMGGAGISSNVKLVIENKKVKSVSIDGKPIDDNKIYHIVTLDYLADGNNGMTAFKNAVKTTNTGITLRDIMIDYVREQTRQGKEITSQLDGRITVLN
ncbi:MAG TPA: 5'-nucleotidase C-terminal domain-containing protein [Dysgonamonadaceae bacterium]|nr:5'-nucleotidase C-terminal domain-containing protein [Dysgonamonadaceae bacterium]HRU13660.1 5'-nucleotidase C-terminal domain-containing protein [Dysgonamonadaceae bacterium]